MTEPLCSDVLLILEEQEEEDKKDESAGEVVSVMTLSLIALN